MTTPLGISPDPPHRRPRARGGPALLLLAVAAAAAAAWLTQQQLASVRPSRFDDQCRRLQRQRDWPALADAAGAWSRREPRNGHAWYYLALAALESRRDDEAVAAILSTPGGDPAWELIGERCLGPLFQKSGRVALGVRICREVLQNDEKNPVARGFLCYYHRLTLNRPALIAEARRAIELQVDTPVLFSSLATLDVMTVKDGEAILAGWLEQFPGDPDLLAGWWGQRLMKARDELVIRGSSADQRAYAQLLAEADQALPSLARPMPLLEILLDAALEQNDAERVAALLEQAPPDAASDPAVWRIRAWYERTAGRLDDARRSLEEARIRDPLSWESHSLLATVDRAQQDFGSAEQRTRLAEEGRELFTEFRSQESIFVADFSLLRRLADYAVKCEDWPVAEALHRRLPPEN